MLRLFRHIRLSLIPGEGALRYLRYALGEIALVVIGILIALQIDTWNDDRIQQAQVREYARALVGDLEADQDMLGEVLRQAALLPVRARRLGDYVRGKRMDQMDNLHLYVYSRDNEYRPYMWNRSALDQIKSAGAFRDMNDPALVKQISAYDALTRHLDQDLQSDVQLGSAAATLASRAVNRNYPDEDFPDTDNLNNDEAHDSPLLDAVVMKIRGTNYDLPMVSNDLRDVEIAVDAYRSMGTGVLPRSEHEIPDLQKMGRDLIARLKTKYRL